MHLTFDSFVQHRKFYKRYLFSFSVWKTDIFSVISLFDVFLLISRNVLKVVVWNGGWERRTIFLLFPQDGSLYLPLPDIQQFIVEYRKTSENVGRSWKMSVLEVPEAMKFISFPGDTITFVGREVFPGPDIRPHTPTLASKKRGWYLHLEQGAVQISTHTIFLVLTFQTNANSYILLIFNDL